MLECIVLIAVFNIHNDRFQTISESLCHQKYRIPCPHSFSISNFSIPGSFERVEVFLCGKVEVDLVVHVVAEQVLALVVPLDTSQL